MLEKTICDEIIEKLEEMDESVYEKQKDASDLAFMLWERENFDGSCTCSAYDAIRWIKENFEDLGEYVEEHFTNTGELLNPFSSPETFQVIMSIEVTMNILYRVYKEGMTKEELIEALQ